MPLDLPASQNEVFQKLATDVQAELPASNPFLYNSYLRALEIGFSGSIYEFYIQLKEAIDQLFYDTAEGDFLERHASLFGITRNPATKASGFITVTGTATTLVPLGTQFVSQQGGLYETLADGTISAHSISVSSLTRVGSTVTATTVSDHNLTSFMNVVISGAVETDYNGTFQIQVTGAESFTYQIAATPSTPATGTILCDHTSVSLEAMSVLFGALQSVDDGTKLAITTPIPGVDNFCFVQWGGLSGGADTETDESLRDRFLFRVQNPVAMFNNNAIINAAKTVSGVTRVWVRNVDTLDKNLTITSLTRTSTFATAQTSANHGLEDGQFVRVSGANETGYNKEVKVLVSAADKFVYLVSGTTPTPATGSPVVDVSITSPGQVRVFFVRDNEVPIIPTGVEIIDVKNAILEITPAHTAESDVMVQAPIPVTVNFVFTALSPNTQDMQTAITSNLQAFFAEGTEVGVDLLEAKYLGAIINTIDSSGNSIQSFTLSTPTGDIAVSTEELPILGSITYP